MKVDHHLGFLQQAAPSTPAAGITDLYAKTDGLMYVLTDDGIEMPLGGPGRMLAYKHYEPAASYTTTSTTYADMDATNLTVTFTAPPSGIVVVLMSAICKASVSGTNGFWSLRDTAGNNIAATGKAVNALNQFVNVTYMIDVTGLTVGASTTYRWGFKTNTGSTFTVGAASDIMLMGVYSG